MLTFLLNRRVTLLKKKMCRDKFINNSFTHFSTLPEEILPARLRVCLLSSTCQSSWVSPTSQGVAKWQLPMSAKMKPREGKKKKNRTDLNFILPSISKWLLSALHQSRETGTVHFYSSEWDCGGAFLYGGKQAGKVSTVNYAGWLTGKTMTMKSTLSKIPLFGSMTAEWKWGPDTGWRETKKVGFHRSSFFMLKSCIRVDFIWHCKSAGDSAACMVQHCGNTCDFVLDLFRKFCFISCVFLSLFFFLGCSQYW